MGDLQEFFDKTEIGLFVMLDSDLPTRISSLSKQELTEANASVKHLLENKTSKPEASSMEE